MKDSSEGKDLIWETSKNKDFNEAYAEHLEDVPKLSLEDSWFKRLKDHKEEVTEFYEELSQSTKTSLLEKM